LSSDQWLGWFWSWHVLLNSLSLLFWSSSKRKSTLLHSFVFHLPVAVSLRIYYKVVIDGHAACYQAAGDDW